MPTLDDLAAQLEKHDMPKERRLVSVCFDKNESSGVVSLWTDGPDLRITINSEWASGRVVVQSASVNESMAMVLRDEISHWLDRQSGARSEPEPVSEEEIEAGAKTLYDAGIPGLRWRGFDQDGDAFRARSRAVLEAARTAREGRLAE